MEPFFSIAYADAQATARDMLHRTPTSGEMRKIADFMASDGLPGWRSALREAVRRALLDELIEGVLKE